MRTLLTSLLLIVVVAVTLLTFGRVDVTPSPTGYGVSVQSDWATVQRVREEQRTARAQIEAEAQMVMTQEREATARLLWPVVAICVAFAVVGVAWSKRSHRPLPPVNLLAYAERNQLEVVLDDGEWWVVDDRKREMTPARLLEMQ